MGKLSKSRGGSRGFSLLEALVAAAIAGSALAGLLLVHYRSISRWTEARHLAVAAELAAGVAAIAESDPDIRAGRRRGGFPDHPAFSWSVTVAARESSPAGDLWTIAVAVRYPAPAGTKTFQLSTLCYRPRKAEEESLEQEGVEQEDENAQSLHSG